MKKLIISAMACLATACAHQDLPPQIGYDEADFGAATPSPDILRPFRIVTIPEPLPLPGQLKQMRERDDEERKDPGAPEDRIIAANLAARIEPGTDGFIDAIQIYPFAEGALYQLYAAPEKVSDIVLQAGESVVSVSAGDTVRWIVGDTVSGEGANARTHILIKPVKPDLESNLVIITDRRAYHVEMHSMVETYMASLSWTYPHDELITLRRQNRQAVIKAEQVADEGLRVDALRFRYAVSGGTPPWRPHRAFDDGEKVYIQFPSNLAQGEAPPLFVLGARGESQLVNYRVRGRYYVVDRLFAAAELRLGEDPQEVVRITRTDVKPRASSANPKRDR